MAGMSIFLSNRSEMAAEVDSVEKNLSAGESLPEQMEVSGMNVAVNRQEDFSPVSLQTLMEKNYDGRALKLENVLEENAAYTRYRISYKSGELTISGIMNIPKGEGPFPVLILNHGYIDPAVYTNGRGLRREQDYLARKGYVVVHPDYRNHAFSDKDPENDLNFRLGYTEDVINAIFAVKNFDNPIFDKNNIGVLGHSMGGGVALNMMVVQPDLVKAVVLFAPVSADQWDNFERWTKTRAALAEKIVATYGTAEENPEFWQNISAENFFGNVKSPVMIHHGTVDSDVPLAWSDKLADNLRKHNVELHYYTYLGEPHEFVGAWSLVMERTAEFFDQQLR